MFCWENTFHNGISIADNQDKAPFWPVSESKFSSLKEKKKFTRTPKTLKSKRKQMTVDQHVCHLPSLNTGVTLQARGALESERPSNNRQRSLWGKTVETQGRRTMPTIWSGDERQNEVSLRMINICEGKVTEQMPFLEAVMWFALRFMMLRWFYHVHRTTTENSNPRAEGP